MDWAANLDAAALGALVSAASAVLVPRIIERVPEPEPDEEPDGGETPAEHVEQADDSTDPTEPTESVAATPVDPAETMPVRAAEQAPAAQPTGQPTAARVAGPARNRPTSRRSCTSRSPTRPVCCGGASWPVRSPAA